VRLLRSQQQTTDLQGTPMPPTTFAEGELDVRMPRSQQQTTDLQGTPCRRRRSPKANSV